MLNGSKIFHVINHNSTSIYIRTDDYIEISKNTKFYYRYINNKWKIGGYTSFFNIGELIPIDSIREVEKVFDWVLNKSKNTPLYDEVKEIKKLL